jgi:hypothetical protein
MHEIGGLRMMLISGTITNTVQQQMINNKWQQKKNSGEILSKEERNERANRVDFFHTNVR